jgi:hypothetical protein
MSLHISHHERAEGHPHRWRVFLHGHDDPIHVQLSPHDREQLEMTDEEIHEVLPNAVVSYHTENRDDQLGDYGSWEKPLEIGHPHFLV